MAGPGLDLDAAAVLRRYAALHPIRDILFLGNRGGFSGARLWRAETAAGPVCIKAWPADGPDAARLAWIHRLLLQARAAGLDFVPAVFAADGATCHVHAGRLWDVTAWMPGRADFRERPTAPRLEQACTALAQLHAAWAAAHASTGPCPSVRRRLARARAWAELVRSGWQPLIPEGTPDPVHAWARQAWELARRDLDGVPRLLAPWADRVLPLQPCLGDVWHDHVLFEGDRVTGLIDHGCVRVDHVAVDLARFLGSTAEDDLALRSAGLRAYARLRPLSWEEDPLVTALDHAGTFLGAANWLRWLYLEQRPYEDRTLVAQRLAALVRRLGGSTPQLA